MEDPWGVGGSTWPAGLAASRQPEKRLMLAVLEAAVADVQTYAGVQSGRGRRIFTEAAKWIGSSDCDRPFDFESICTALGLDPSFIRSGLLRWCAARRRASVPARQAPATSDRSAGTHGQEALASAG
jgi:hypothetical protein